MRVSVFVCAGRCGVFFAGVCWGGMVPVLRRSGKVFPSTVAYLWCI